MRLLVNKYKYIEKTVINHLDLMGMPEKHNDIYIEASACLLY